MSQVTILQAQAQLSHLIQQALAGEDVVIIKGKKPLVRIVPAQKARVPKTSSKSGAGKSVKTKGATGSLDENRAGRRGYAFLDQLVGMCESGITDASVNHDRIIYELKNKK